jgi:hypothetical protein
MRVLTASSFSTELGRTMRFIEARVLKNFFDAPMTLSFLSCPTTLRL